LEQNVATLETSEAAENQWIATIGSMAFLTEKFFKDCTPRYNNNEGKHDGKGTEFLQGQ